MVEDLKRTEEKKQNPWKDITDPQEFIDFLDEWARALLRNKDSKDMIPDLVMRRGYMRWSEMLRDSFHAFEWMREDELEPNLPGFHENDLDRFLFSRFSQQFLAKETFSWLDHEEKSQLRDKAWESYQNH